MKRPCVCAPCAMRRPSVLPALHFPMQEPEAEKKEEQEQPDTAPAPASAAPGGEDSAAAAPSQPSEQKQPEEDPVSSSTSSRPMGGTATASVAEIGTSRLRFFTWWYEDIESSDLTFRVDSNSQAGGGLKRRYVTLDYSVASHTFTMRSAADDQDLVVPGALVVSSGDKQAEVWDLHVGACVTVLGRNMTLLKADLETAKWIDAHAARLKKIKVEMLAELQKYKPAGRASEVVFDRGDKTVGGLNLRHTVNQIHKLADELQQYRPSKGEGRRCV
jgi:hypothetical protein